MWALRIDYDVRLSGNTQQGNEDGREKSVRQMPKKTGNNAVLGSGQKKRRGNMNICGDCREYHCPWMEKGEPVPGWTAKKVTLHLFVGKDADTYDVRRCPMFREPYEEYELPDMRFSEGHGNCGKYARRQKPIVATCLENGMVRRYESTYAAVRDGFIHSGIIKCLNGTNKTHKGWTFKRACT